LPPVKTRRGHLLPMVLLFGLAALVRITVADRHGLWADEFFSLAIATGPAWSIRLSKAVPALGDFVGRDSLGRGGTGGGLASGARHLGRRLPDAERPGALFRRSGRRIRRQ
jgi:hypothetical protein